MKREVRKKPRLQLDPGVKVLIKQVVIGVGLFALLGTILATVWHVTRLPALSIDTVTARGGETISADEVRSRAEAVLAGAYGRVIPKRFFLTYPQKEILSAVEGVDRIKNVVTERVSMNELVITYGEYTPFALWCDAEPAEGCLFLDERGYAFAPAPPLTGSTFVRYRSGVEEPEIGKNIMSVDDFWTTVTFMKLLEVKNFYVRVVDVDSVGDVYYELVGGGELRAVLTQSPQAAYDNLHTILNSADFSHLEPDNFRYIDLRFGNKIYINEELESSAATSTATTTDTLAEDDVTIKSVVADVESEVEADLGAEVESSAMGDGGDGADSVTIQFAN